MVLASASLVALITFFTCPAAASGLPLYPREVQAVFTAPVQPTTQSQSRMVLIETAEGFWPGIHIKLKPGWHTYWMNPGDSGAAPQLRLKTATAMPNEVSILHPIPKRKSFGPLNSFLHEGQAMLVLSGGASGALLNDLPESSVTLAGEFLVCTEEECLPSPFSLEAKPSEWTRESQSAAAKLLKESFNTPHIFPPDEPALVRGDVIQTGPNRVHIEMRYAKTPGQPSVSDNVTLTDFIDETGLKVSSSQPEPIASGLRLEASDLWKTQYFSGSLTEPGRTLMGIVFYQSQTNSAEQKTVKAAHILLNLGVTGAAQAASPADAGKVIPAPVGDDTGIWWAILLAFFGGIVLNAMPCVFPVLFIKALSVLNARGVSDHSSAKGNRAQELGFLVGVVLTFVLLGMALFAVRQAGIGLGWGSQLQFPPILFLLSFLFLYLALGFFGAAPKLLGSMSGLAGSWAGEKATLTQRSRFSSEVTAGVISVLVASPCTGPFMAQALGFALLTASPLEGLLVFTSMGLGFALPMTLLEIAPATARLLPKPGPWLKTFETAMGFPMLGTCLWLIWIADQTAPQEWRWLHFSTTLLLAAFGIWLFFVNQISRSLRIFAGCCVVLAVVLGVSSGQWPAVNDNLTPRLNTDHVAPLPRGPNESGGGITFEAFSPERLSDLLKQGKPVFVDFTAAWCVTCQVNKTVVFNRPHVGEQLRAWNVTPLVADWTNYDPVLTQELSRHGRSGVPLYLFYSGQTDQPLILPQILTPSLFLEAIATQLGESPP